MNPPTHNRAIAPASIIRGLFTAIALLPLTGFSQSFEEVATFDESEFGFVHGTLVPENAYADRSSFISPRITVQSPTSSITNAVIFDTRDPRTKNQSSDTDLIPNGTGNAGSVNFGNVVIVQENTDFTVTNGRIDNPYVKVDDDANGGLFTIDLNPSENVRIDAFQLDFIDVEKAGQIAFRFHDAEGSNFTWTGADLQRDDPTIMFGDASANRTRFLTAMEMNLNGITRFEAISSTSFALDNFRVKGTLVPEPSSGLLTMASALLFSIRRRRNAG